MGTNNSILSLNSLIDNFWDGYSTRYNVTHTSTSPTFTWVDAYDDITGSMVRNTSVLPSIFEEVKLSPFQPHNFPHNIIISEDGALVFQIAATGFSKEEIGAELDGDVLTVKLGSEEKKPQKDDYRKFLCHKLVTGKDTEFSYRISDRYDMDSVKTSLENGVLNITFALKAEVQKARKKLDIG